MTRQQYRHPGSFALILVAIGALLCTPAMTFGDDEPSFDDLRTQMYKLYKDGNYKKALECAEKMHEMKADDLDAIYSLACLHCLNGDKDKAYDWLEKSIAAGFPTVAHLKADDDFKTIRAEDRFRSLVRKLAKMEAEKEGKKADDTGKVKKADDPAKQAEQIEDLAKTIEGLKKKLGKKDVEIEALKARIAELGKKQPAPQQGPDGPPLNPFGITGADLNAKVTALTQELIQVSGAGERYKALAIALEARNLADIGLTNYNVACMYSLVDKKDESFRYLARSIELGGFSQDMVAQIENDSDFDNVRDDPRYKEMIEKAKKGSPQRASREQGRAVDAEYKITLPPNHNKSSKAPLIVAMHGYGGNMEETIDAWKDAAAEVGAILLTPQGGFRLDNNAYHWGRGIDAIEENVLDAIDDVVEDYNVDTSKVVIAGFSQGGWASWLLAVRNPDIFRGAIPVAGRFVGVSPESLEDEELEKLRVFVMVGADDQELIIDDNRQAVKRFNEIGAKAELHLYDNVAHAFPDNATEEQVKALKFVLAA